MTRIVRIVALGICAVMMMGALDALVSPIHVGVVREAEAGIVIRHARRAAIVTTAVVASSSASASAAATANANAAATANANAAAASAEASAAAASKAAAAAAAPAIGTIVTTLPAGCTQEKLNGVDYMRCGSTYYKTSMMGTNLVFVVAQP